MITPFQVLKKRGLIAKGQNETWQVLYAATVDNIMSAMDEYAGEHTKLRNPGQETHRDLLVAYDVYLKQTEDSGCGVLNQKKFHDGFLDTLKEKK